MAVVMILTTTAVVIGMAATAVKRAVTSYNGVIAANAIAWTLSTTTVTAPKNVARLHLKGMAIVMTTTITAVANTTEAIAVVLMGASTSILIAKCASV